MSTLSKYTWFSVVVVFACVYGAQAQYQNKPIERLTQETGLVQNSVFKIFQDRQGYMWFGTMGGLSRYDGYSFVNFKREAYNTNSLPDNWVNQILEDSHGMFWVGTHNGGLSRFDPKKSRFFNFVSQKGFSESLRNPNIWGLFQDSAQMLWIGHDAGMDIIDPLTNKEVYPQAHLAINKVLDGHSVNVFVEMGSKMFLGTWGSGLIVYDRVSHKTQKYAKLSGFPDDKVKDLLVYSDSILMVGTQRHGVVRFNVRTGAWSVLNLGEAQGCFALSVTKDVAGKIWIGTQRNGLVNYDPFSGNVLIYKHLPSVRFGLPSDWVPDLYIDKSGVLWIGGDGGVGKTQARESGFDNYLFDLLNEDQKSFEVHSILPVGKSLWLGTIGGGLCEFDMERGKLVDDRTKDIMKVIKNDRVWALVADSYGSIWLGTGQGLFRYFVDTGKLESFYANGQDSTNFMIHDNVSCLSFDGESLWIGTWGSGFSVVNLKTMAFEKYEYSERLGSLSNNYISAFHRDNLGRFWVGTQGGGLNLLDRKRGSFQCFRYNEGVRNSLSSDNVEDIVSDAENNLWVATNGGGLSVMYAGTHSFKSFTEKDGLSDNNVMRIVLGRDDKIWLATSQGLTRMDVREKKFEVLTRQNGLTVDEFSQGLVQNADGSFWLSTNQGMVLVEPNKVHTVGFEPVVVLTKFKRFNKTEIIENLLNKDGVLELNVNDQVISFEFAALDFRASSEIRYAYKLVGLNNKWEHIDNQHSITFPSLPHGNYELRIKATNSEGKWSRNEYVLRISVPPPFYLTTWFVLLVICSILGVVYLFVWWRTLQLKSIQTLLTKQVLERTMELRAEKSKVEDYSQEVERQRDFVTQQRDLIYLQNKELTDSIVYAKRIQNGLLPSFTELSAFFSDSFLIFKPRDIVSGDFYWMYLQNNILYIAAADCTGHGVPGAFMSLLGIASLNEIMKSYDSMSASDVLSALKEEIVETLQRGANHVQIRESIDIALVKLNLDTLVLEFAGAYNPLVVIRKGDVALEAAHRASYNSSQNVVLSEFRGQRIPIGFNDKNVGSYESYSMQVRKGDRFYLFSDGFVDQLNEAFTQKFYLKRLKDLLLNIQDLSMPDQQRALENAHYNWKGSSRQIDDILLVGFEI